MRYVALVIAVGRRLITGPVHTLAGQYDSEFLPGDFATACGLRLPWADVAITPVLDSPPSALGHPCGDCHPA